MNFSQFQKQYQIRLDPQQAAAVQRVEGPVLLLAVPGSGKTTVLVSRIGYMLHACGIRPEKILTMTYTVAAAADMRRRYAAFFGEEPALEFRTINGVCSRIIRLYERTMGRTAFRLLEDGGQKSALLAELCRQQSGDFAQESTIKAVETAITYVKNQMLSGEELASVKVEGVDFPPVFQAYCKILRERQQMDFDDQMIYALQILRQYPQILQLVQNQYQYFCVDEAQDTSKIQHVIIRLLASRSRNLFMVGDEDQSIYGFRAAYPQALTEFEKKYPEAAVLYMEQNYRSTCQIVAAADRVIRKNQKRRPKTMRAVRGEGPQVRELSVYDRQEQYRWLCKEASGCKQETAVLYRDNDSILPVIDLLDREELPYRCRQVESLFFSNRSVRDVVDIFRFAMDPSDGDRFLNIYYKMGAGISKAAAQEAVQKAPRAGKSFLQYISLLPQVSAWTKRQCITLEKNMQLLVKERGDLAVSRVVHHMGYGDYLQEREMDDSKMDILQALGMAQANPGQLLHRLEELRDLVLAGGSGEQSCPFILSTIHSSKGLEYENVILLDVIDGIFPKLVCDEHATDEEKEANEEERRLFYVGMTRAKQQLSLFTFRKAGVVSSFAEDVFPRRRNAPKSKPITSVEFKRIQKQEALDTDCYQPGTRIFHEKFGSGILTGRTGDIVTIAFEDVGSKRLSLSTALRSKAMRLE